MSRGTLMMLTAASLVIAACRPATPSLSSAILILPAAENVKVGPPLETFDDGVTYDVATDSPEGLVTAVIRHMEGQGWRPRDRSTLNAESPTGAALGWVNIRDTDGSPARMWQGEWQDHKGRLVIYDFRYRTAQVEPGRYRVSVAGMVRRPQGQAQ